VSFTLDAKVRNGIRLTQAARLCLIAALDGGICHTGYDYEDWTQAVIDSLETIAVKELPKLPRSRYNEDGETDCPEDVEPYHQTVDELRCDASGLWDDTGRAREKLAHLLADGRSKDVGVVRHVWQICHTHINREPPVTVRAEGETTRQRRKRRVTVGADPVADGGARTNSCSDAVVCSVESKLFSYMIPTILPFKPQGYRA
jgi:hypothetical protein